MNETNESNISDCPSPSAGPPDRQSGRSDSGAGHLSLDTPEMRFAVIVTLLVLGAGLACVECADTYYVSTHGKDEEGRGGESDPFQSVKFALGQAGDEDVTIRMLEGEYPVSKKKDDTFPASLTVEGLVLEAWPSGAEVTVLLSYSMHVHKNTTLRGITFGVEVGEHVRFAAGVQVASVGVMLAVEECEFKKVEGTRFASSGVSSSLGSFSVVSSVFSDGSGVFVQRSTGRTEVAASFSVVDCVFVGVRDPISYNFAEGINFFGPFYTYEKIRVTLSVRNSVFTNMGRAISFFPTSSPFSRDETSSGEVKATATGSVVVFKMDNVTIAQCDEGLSASANVPEAAPLFPVSISNSRFEDIGEGEAISLEQGIAIDVVDTKFVDIKARFGAIGCFRSATLSVVSSSFDDVNGQVASPVGCTDLCAKDSKFHNNTVTHCSSTEHRFDCPGFASERSERQ